MVHAILRSYGVLQLFQLLLDLRGFPFCLLRALMLLLLLLVQLQLQMIILRFQILQCCLLLDVRSVLLVQQRVRLFFLSLVLCVTPSIHHHINPHLLDSILQNIDLRILIFKQTLVLLQLLDRFIQIVLQISDVLLHILRLSTIDPAPIQYSMLSGMSSIAFSIVITDCGFDVSCTDCSGSTLAVM